MDQTLIWKKISLFCFQFHSNFRRKCISSTQKNIANFIKANKENIDQEFTWGKRYDVTCEIRSYHRTPARVSKFMNYLRIHIFIEFVFNQNLHSHSSLFGAYLNKTRVILVQYSWNLFTMNSKTSEIPKTLISQILLLHWFCLENNTMK